MIGNVTMTKVKKQLDVCPCVRERKKKGGEGMKQSSMFLRLDGNKPIGHLLAVVCILRKQTKTTLITVNMTQKRPICLLVCCQPSQYTINVCFIIVL